MIKDTKKLPVSKLFPEDKPGIRYSVPIFQRVYSWKKPNWDALLSDIWDSEPGYFLGTIICIPEPFDSKKRQIYRVIDGQQRLISLILMYASIHSLLRSYEDKHNPLKHKSHNTSRIQSLQKILVTNQDSQQFRITPPKAGNNHILFDEVMRNSLYGRECDEKNLMFKAYDFFRSEIGKRAEEKAVESKRRDLKEIADLKRLIDRALMVRIDVLSTEDAYILFESLNNRGLPLSISDIIKNQILSRFDKPDVDKNELQRQAEVWQGMIDNLGEDSAIQERYFRHYYNAFRLDFPQLYSGVDTGVQNIGRAKVISMFEKLANDKNVAVCMHELSEKAKLYDSLIHPEHCKLKKCKDGLADLDRIGAANSYQLLMYLLTVKAPEEKLQQLIDFLVKFYVRRNLTDKPRSRDMDALFIDQIELLRNEPGNIDQVITNLKSKSAIDDEFEAKLRGDIYEDNRAACRFILCKIEASHYKGDELLPDLWRRHVNKYRFEIEHIFPQGPNIPQAWINMIAEGNEKNAKKLQDDYVHRLGNLTLTAHNKELRNWPFEKKRDHMVDEKITGYRNGLHLNKDLADEPTWTVEKIEKRTNTLVEKALSLFKYSE